MGAAASLIPAGISLVSSLMGGGDTEITPYTSGGMTPEQLSAWQNMLGQLGQYQNTGYTGQMVAGMTPEQTQAINVMTKALSDGNKAVNQGQNLLSQTLQGNFLKPDANPYGQAMADAISRPIKEQIKQQQDALASQAQMSGIGGSSPYMTQSRLLQERGLGQLGEGLSNLYGNMYASERQNQQNALSLAPTYANLPFQQASQLFNVGEQARGVTNQQLQAKYSDWLRTQNPSQAQQLMAQLISGVPGQQTQYFQQTDIPWYQNLASGLSNAVQTGVNAYDWYSKLYPTSNGG